MKTLVLAFVALSLGLIASACASAGDGPNTSATSRATETPEQAYWGGVLKQLRIESGEFALQALQAWARMENTKAQWNPLATTLQKPGSSDFNSAGVKNYPDQATGVQATADTLLYTPSGSGSYYKAVREMLSQESFNRQELQVALNKWSDNGPYVPGLLDKWAALWSEKVAKQSTEAAAPVASADKPAAPIAATPRAIDLWALAQVDSKEAAKKLIERAAQPIKSSESAIDLWALVQVDSKEAAKKLIERAAQPIKSSESAIDLWALGQVDSKEAVKKLIERAAQLKSSPVAPTATAPAATVPSNILIFRDGRELSDYYDRALENKNQQVDPLLYKQIRLTLEVEVISVPGRPPWEPASYELLSTAQEGKTRAEQIEVKCEAGPHKPYGETWTRLPSGISSGQLLTVQGTVAVYYLHKKGGLSLPLGSITLERCSFIE